ncbi:uncharacterized protein BYT42DRAFT_589889 [Radiomyces spectabilis]|uniref:uncharacterized protein n=1 Tax=Radiomyces spectabilis TaxID=64574 RepID=UPI0022209FCC|nr:uncharacterized protein BYT42DRAFT_589889 [Radiomyces spectabilis]KAI8364636.1 hypothetical protein BYT42DRAFT_589889 [Radiomyces spectabilis]
MNKDQSIALPPWLPLSFVLATHLYDNCLHVTFLTSSEAQYFEDAVRSYHDWVTFITCREKPASASATGTLLTEAQIAAFRVRAMLSDQFIAYTYSSTRLCCHDTHVNFNMIFEKARLITSQIDDLSASEHSMPTHDTSRNYDQNENMAEASPHADLMIMSDTEVIPLQCVYHTLEEDLATMIEQRKIQEFEAKQALTQAADKQKGDALSLSIMNANGNLNLKYLLKGIAANRHQMSLSDRELEHLLSDFKSQRPKWSQDEKSTQEEMYEKVLNELKNFTEHSTPFLNKVQRRDAPDYYDVIKRPMDLGTVTKKLKSNQYKSKKEFADDLYLIYQNCLTYNTNPASEYRKHAKAMRRKTDQLLSRIPDVEIKERSEADVEDEADDGSDHDEDNEYRSGKTTKAHKHPIKSNTGRPETDSPDPSLRSSRERSMTRASSMSRGGTPLTTEFGDFSSPRTHTPSNEQHDGIGLEFDHNHLGTEQEIIVSQDMDMENDLQEQTWREVTKKTRAKITDDVERQYQFPFEEHEALIRSSLDMERLYIMQLVHSDEEKVLRLIQVSDDSFARWTDRRDDTGAFDDRFDADSSDDENFNSFSRKTKKSSKLEEDSAVRSDLFLPEYKMSCGIPEVMEGIWEQSCCSNLMNSQSSRTASCIDSIVASMMQSKSETDVPFDVYSSVRFMDYGLNPMIDRNISTLEKIRVIYSKCHDIKNNLPVSSSTPFLSEDLLRNSTSSPINSNTSFDDMHFANEDGSAEYDHTNYIPHASSSNPPLLLNDRIGRQITQQTITKLLTHAGFEGAQTTSLNVLTDLAVDYLSNIGRTLRWYWDNYGQTMQPEELMAHTLYENGVMSLKDLESYIVDDIERYGGRLDDIYRRLQQSYNDLVSAPDTEKTSNAEALLDDESNFLTGAFGEELGDDYFGFKELGLDKELNINSFSIPLHLWVGRRSDKKETKKEPEEAQSAAKYPYPGSFTSVTSENQLIGLLKPFFMEKLATSSGALIEDEQIPNRHRNRPRYPPIKKNFSNKKGSSKDAVGDGGSQGDKKGKRRRGIEEIQAEKAERAEKRRQKLEERAQRLAEKEEKRRIREEIKEQERLAKLEAKERKQNAKKSKHTTEPRRSSPITSSLSPHIADIENS